MENNSVFMITGKTYETLKKIVQIVLPALATLYFALAGIWDLPAAGAVVATITSVTTFLGVLLGISNKNYAASDTKYDGQINVFTKDDGVLVNQFDVNIDPETFGEHKSFLLKVNNLGVLPPEYEE